MNAKVYQEIEQFIVSARMTNEMEFDRMLDGFLVGRITEDKKDEFCEALAAFHADRIQQFIAVEERLAELRQMRRVEKSVKEKPADMFEMEY